VERGRGRRDLIAGDLQHVSALLDHEAKVLRRIDCSERGAGGRFLL
jgi:hypothetical protein